MNLCIIMKITYSIDYWLVNHLWSDHYCGGDIFEHDVSQFGWYYAQKHLLRSDDRKIFYFVFQINSKVSTAYVSIVYRTLPIISGICCHMETVALKGLIEWVRIHRVTFVLSHNKYYFKKLWNLLPKQTIIYSYQYLVDPWCNG